MSEAQRIVALSRRAQARGEQLCLATVVHVEGSAYRKPGARMLLTSGGERAGTISGGCLEAEVSRKAWWLTANGARLERYSSYADEDGGMPYGLGCGGTVSLLLEQGEAVSAVISALAQGAEAQQPSVVVMTLAWEGSGSYGPAGTLAVLAARPGAQRNEEDKSLGLALETLYLRNAPDRVANGAAYELPAGLLQAAEEAFRQKRCLFLTDACVEVPRTPVTGNSPLPAYFVEYLAPAPALTIFGAGDDAQPIAELASSLGWRVTVADGRAHLARRERFPSAAEIRVLNYPDPSLRAACGLGGAQRSRQAPVHTAESAIAGPAPVPGLEADALAVVLTHSYEQDRAILASLLPRCLQYLGILGPRHRTERLLAEVAPPLALTIEECFARLHSPIGLDLGAGDPAAVALSIIAEIQAVLHNRQVQITREAPAHEPASEPAQPWPDTPEAAVRA